MLNIPKIANITDIRYSWTSLIAEIEKEEKPLLVLDRSTPKAVILPIKLAEKLLKLPVSSPKSKTFKFHSKNLGKIKIPLTREYMYE